MVETIRIPATRRTEFGKGSARRVRVAHQIPAVVYGHGAEPQHVVIPGHATMLAVRNSNAVLELDVDGESQLVMVKDIQRHTTRPEILHLDLLTVRSGERVEVEIPVHVTGEVHPNAVHNVEENVLIVDAEALTVPEALTIDIEGLEAGQHVLARDVQLPAGVSLVSEPELIVVNVSAPVAQDLGDEAAEGDVVPENQA